MKAAFAPPPCLLEEDANRSDPSKNEYDLFEINLLKKAIWKFNLIFLTLLSGLLKAEKMMVKMGYKGGEGLGKNKQGISTALQVEKTGLRTGRIVNEKEIGLRSTLWTILITYLMIFNFFSSEQPSFAMPKETKNSPNPSSQPVAVGIRTDVMKNMSRVILLRVIIISLVCFKNSEKIKTYFVL